MPQGRGSSKKTSTRTISQAKRREIERRYRDFEEQRTGKRPPPGFAARMARRALGDLNVGVN